MNYRLPPLGYPYDALEPYLDAATMELHHTRHHATYVEGLSRVLANAPKLAGMSLEDILVDLRVVPEDLRQHVRNFGGGHLNHSLLWHVLAPGGPGEPTGQLRDALVTAFDTFGRFMDHFANACMTRFGSGWGWLCVDPRGGLEILSTPNQDSPIMQGCRPILGCDLWEHAYYLKYHNRRSEYIAAWWNCVNWDHVGQLYGDCLTTAMRVHRA